MLYIFIIILDVSYTIYVIKITYVQCGHSFPMFPTALYSLCNRGQAMSTWCYLRYRWQRRLLELYCAILSRYKRPFRIQNSLFNFWFRYKIKYLLTWFEQAVHCFYHRTRRPCLLKSDALFSDDVLFSRRDKSFCRGRKCHFRYFCGDGLIMTWEWTLKDFEVDMVKLSHLTQDLSWQFSRSAT